MSDLFVCYSPKGEKFELTRPNYQDATQNYGFTVSPPSAVAVSDEPDDDENADVDTDADENGDENADADDDANDTDDDDADDTDDDASDFFTVAADFPEDKGEIKDYIEAKFPDAVYDKRMGRDDLIAFAIAKAEEATA